jgi:hypothetical protein
MASELGVTIQNDGALRQLVAGECIEHFLKIDELVPVVVGQVVQYNTTEDNFDAYTSGMAATMYAVIAEDKTIAADTVCRCIVKGKVRKKKLDSVAQADLEIDVALIKCGNIPVPDDVRVA